MRSVYVDIGSATNGARCPCGKRKTLYSVPHLTATKVFRTEETTFHRKLKIDINRHHTNVVKHFFICNSFFKPKRLDRNARYTIEISQKIQSLMKSID